MFDREKAIASIEAGGCPCEDCRGRLTDPNLSTGAWAFCKVCRCAWKVETIYSVRYAASIHAAIHTKAREPQRQITEADYDGHEDLR